ncbi:hypothetical protein OS493_004729 [Desmophyllum pertusum]|uniref:Uncharacterized protein n=1 Tax=Desmophyllum pertusum TaxID=174260 RepID=A0A9X0CZF2_9CNID|nr:hypothetical protein OS493_004729 [Desmophyllum pertusum]
MLRNSTATYAHHDKVRETSIMTMIHVKPRAITQQVTYNLRWLETEGREINLSGIAVSSEGQIAVCDQGNNRLILLNEDGVFRETIGRSGRENGGVVLTRWSGVQQKQPSVCFPTMETIAFRCTITELENLALLSVLAAPVMGQLAFPSGLSVDDNENIIVSDWGNNRVQVFDERGNFKLKFSSHAAFCGKSLGCLDQESGLSEPQHCISFKNSYFMADGSANCVKVFNESGMFLHNIGCMDSPQGLTISDRDILCVCDSNKNCIRLYYLDGKIITNFPNLNWPMYLANGKNGEVFVTERGTCQVTVLKLP